MEGHLILGHKRNNIDSKMADNQQSPEHSNRGSEGHSESERLREEYFGESGSLPRRRSERLQQSNQGREGEYNVTPLMPPHDLTSVWIKDETGRPMRVWYMRLGDKSAYYGADGSRVDATREELTELEVPLMYVQRYWRDSLTVPRCQHRAIMRKLMEWVLVGELPTERQWKAWLAPNSTEVYIEFMCQECEAKCKTFNQFASYVEGAEMMGRATCTLFGTICRARNMEEALPLNYARLEALCILPRMIRYSPSASLQDEGMVTARGPPEEENVEEQHTKVVPRRRRVRGSRFTPIMRPMQRSRKRAIARMETNPTRGNDVPKLPIPELFHWDEEQDPIRDVSIPVTPLSLNQPSTAREPEQTQQEMEGLREELTSLRQLVQRLQLSGPQSESPVTERDRIPVESFKGDVTLRPTPAFPMSEMLCSQPTDEEEQQEIAKVTATADSWIHGLDGDKLKPMAKAMGRVVAATNYEGESNPIMFAAWCDSIQSLMPMYDIPPGPSQVQAATWFLAGTAKQWWTGICAMRGYGQLQTLEDLFTALKEQFQPSDAKEQMMAKWITLKQTHSVTAYMNEVDSLHNTWRLGEKAEFGLALHGMKKELKGVIRRSLQERKLDFVSLKELRTLAINAEIEKFDPPAARSSMFAPYTKSIARQPARFSSQMSPLTVGAVELRDPKKNTASITSSTASNKSYTCGICNMHNHITPMCRYRKKEGCWRCGGKHHLRDCRALFAKSSLTSTTDQEKARSAVLAIISKTPEEDEVFELVYPVRVNSSQVIAVANIDTGAQCSALRHDVAQAAGIEWNKIRNKGCLRSVSGEPLVVYGKARIRIQAGGLTSMVDVYIVDGIRPQLILGLPWIKQEQPQVEWGDSATLVFPDESKWTCDEGYTNPSLMNESIGKHAYLEVVQTETQEKDRKELPEPKELQMGSIASWLKTSIAKYNELFTPLTGIPPDDRVRHAIQLIPGALPVMKRPYRLSAEQKKSADEQIRNAMKEGWIQPSTSPWGTAILMVPKKDNTWRMCVDYRDLNALTIADAYPLPRIDDLLHRLGRAKYFSKLDLQSGYHQIWIEPQDRAKTAFRINEPVDGNCHFEWRVMPFGLKNAPPTFQRYMTLVMNECADCCLVYMDDLLVFSETHTDHIQHVIRVFDILMKAKLKVKMSKCVFGTERVEFLGHVISQGHIDMETSKRKAILQWTSPLTSAREVRQFMGIVSYYRNFVPHLATIAEPLTRLTRKRIRIEWGYEAQEAMEALKRAILNAQTLSVWDNSLPTRVSTDASDVGMGAIIEQKHETGWKITSSWSRKLTLCQQRYSTTDREWLTAVECITRVWRHWLLGKEFELRTDHAALREILTKKGEDFTYRQLRWYERLEPYTFTVKYIKGKENVVPDALSRTPKFFSIGAMELMPPSPHAKIDKAALVEAIVHDMKYTSLRDNPELCARLHLSVNAQGLLETAGGQVCVPNNDILQYKLVLEAHEPMFAGHFSERKTLEHVRRHWWWPNMTIVVYRVVSGCPICQYNATKKQTDEGPYHPIPAAGP